MLGILTQSVSGYNLWGHGDTKRHKSPHLIPHHPSSGLALPGTMWIPLWAPRGPLLLGRWEVVSRGLWEGLSGTVTGLALGSVPRV